MELVFSGNKQPRRDIAITNGYSTSLRHHTPMQVLFIAWYNFSRKNESLKNHAPALASGLSDHVWTVKELVEGAAEARYPEGAGAREH
jgi:hypothetical protein